MQQVSINRELQNDKFASWRLGREFVTSRADVPLPGPVAVADTGAVNDYLHTRASVLHDHLQQSAGRVFVFTAASGGVQSTSPGRAAAVQVWQVLPCPAAHPPVLLHKLADLPACTLPSGASLAPGACPSDCSLAVVEQAAGSNGSNGSSSQEWQLLLVSQGWGDVRLLQVGAGNQLQAMSAPVFPLRARPPLAGVTPLKLEGAYLNGQGVLRCVMSAVRARTDAQPGACELHMATLTLTPTVGAGQPGLHVQDVQPMACSSLPPHCVTCSPAMDAVLLGLEPAGLEVHLPHTQGTTSAPAAAAPGLAAGAAAGAGAPAGAAAGVAGSVGTGAEAGGPTSSGAQQGPMEAEPAEPVEHVECRPPGWLKAGDDDEECDVDPRTLAEAAARLAKYTSEEPVGNLAPQQWADLYKEGGPEDVTAEAACELLVWSPAPGAAAGAEGAGSTAAASWRMSCGAHKVLTADTPGLLAVTDDVDACVLTVGWEATPLQGTAAPVPLPLQQPCARHEATIPALAYIASGKTQRKQLLLGSVAAPSPCAAVLVEGTKFYYVYGRIVGQPSHGSQQVVDMQLLPEERVLGAALLGGLPWVPAPGAGTPASALLLILTQQRLLVHVLSA